MAYGFPSLFSVGCWIHYAIRVGILKWGRGGKTKVRRGIGAVLTSL